VEGVFDRAWGPHRSLIFKNSSDRSLRTHVAHVKTQFPMCMLSTVRLISREHNVFIIVDRTLHSELLRTCERPDRHPEFNNPMLFPILCHQRNDRHPLRIRRQISQQWANSLHRCGELNCARNRECHCRDQSCKNGVPRKARDSNGESRCGLSFAGASLSTTECSSRETLAGSASNNDVCGAVALDALRRRRNGFSAWSPTGPGRNNLSVGSRRSSIVQPLGAVSRSACCRQRPVAVESDGTSSHTTAPTGSNP